jgi:hypothetical protein
VGDNANPERKMGARPDSRLTSPAPQCDQGATANKATGAKRHALAPPEGSSMERVAIIARLKEGSEPRAAELVAAGPPFDLADTGILRHSIYISSSEAVFVSEGHEVEWIVDELIDDPFHYELQRALEQWREIVEGQPRVARERYAWQLDVVDPAAAPAPERRESWA